jgi:hydrogenase expression/formation protein HypC
MCLAVPGKVIEVPTQDPFSHPGKVNFGGIVKQVNLALVPEAQVGDHVLVHVGFAISKLDEAEAERVFNYLREMKELAELEEGE